MNEEPSVVNNRDLRRDDHAEPDTADAEEAGGLTRTAQQGTLVIAESGKQLSTCSYVKRRRPELHDQLYKGTALEEGEQAE